MQVNDGNCGARRPDNQQRPNNYTSNYLLVAMRTAWGQEKGLRRVRAEAEDAFTRRDEIAAATSGLSACWHGAAGKSPVRKKPLVQHKGLFSGYRLAHAMIQRRCQVSKR